jgi:23S rRNA pseudouridine1911/1915/1917 synthase
MHSSSSDPNLPALEVLHEDNHCIVVNKRPSDIVQGDKTGDEPLSERIKTYLKTKYNKPGNVFCGVVHRLDRPTSGALLFARTSKGLSRLNDQFRDKRTRKVYWAVVENMPQKEQDTLTHYLRKVEKQNKSFLCEAGARNAKKAVLHYRLLGSSSHYHLLEVELETGRHHQIRCQLAAIGCPIKGDLKYGAKRSNPDGSIHLHARALSFYHPTGGELIRCVAPVPDESLWQFFQQECKAEETM